MIIILSSIVILFFVLSFFNIPNFRYLFLANISMMLYTLSTGIREGYTWAIDKKNENGILITESNPLICSEIRTGKGILDYHSWRILENFAIIGIIISISKLTHTWLSCILMFILLYGTYSIIYQIGLNQVISDGKFFLDKDKKSYKFLYFVLPVIWYLPIVRLVLGLIIMAMLYINIEIANIMMYAFIMIYFF